MSLKNLSVKNKIPKLLKNKLDNKKISQIYKRFEKFFKLKEPFAVAVSGGPDSLALAFLSKIYSIKFNLNSKFFIVDHKLRKESTKEAKLVQQILKKYLINAEILTWQGKKPAKNIQSLARKKRYKLLKTKCDKYKINNLLLGHQQDDLIENFFIRIFRGSGLNGLTSLSLESKTNQFNLLRPLLYEKKEDLEFLSKYIFSFYVQDPSNEDEKYQRIKIRKYINELDKKVLDKKKFVKTIKNLKNSNYLVNFYVNENLRKNMLFISEKNKSILNKEFFSQPHEIILRSLSKQITLIGNKYYSVRGKKLDRIIDKIKNDGSLKLTLGGCIIEKVNQTVIITKEY